MTGTPPCYEDYDGAITPTDFAFPNNNDQVGPGTTQSSVIRFGDLNGDGMSDYAVLDSQGLHVCLRNGGGWDNSGYKCVTDPTLTGNDQTNAGLPHPTILIGDVDGSGINQVVYFPSPLTPFGPPFGNATAVRVSPQTSSAQGPGRGPPDGLLQTITTGAGATTTFSYQSVHELNKESGIGNLPVPTWVVTGTSTLNHFANAGFADHPATITKTYTYQGPVYDNRERQFVGFKSVQEVTQGDGVNAKGRSVRTTFATDACTPPVGDVVDGDFGCTVPTTDYSLYHAIRGLPNSVETSQCGAERGHLN